MQKLPAPTFLSPERAGVERLDGPLDRDR